jgi:replicative DNA helicase
VLAGLLLDPGRIAEVAAALKPVDFADKVNRTVYRAMLRLHSAGKPIAVTLVVGELRDRGQYNKVDRVSAATLVELFRLSPCVRTLPYYLERAADMSERRRLLVLEF